MSNMEVAWGAEKEFGAEIVVIKKTSQEHSQMKDPMPCPSVVVNGRVVTRNHMVTQRALKAAIMSDCET
jgi:hypothetical protein